MPSTHSQRLERWLGADQMATLERSLKGWYGPPVPVLNCPGKGPIFAHGDGGFSGNIPGGSFASLADWLYERAKGTTRRWADRQARTMNTGFSSFSDLIAEATSGGKRREYAFQKAGATGVAGISSSLWRVGSAPSAGGAASNAPGGNSPTKATAGAIPFDNPSNPDTQFLVSAAPACGTAGNTLLLYDRIFEVNKTMSSNATEAVTGVPTRYQSTTASDPDYCGGNFMFPEVQATLGATGHNWTVMKYTNQAGTTGQSAPSLTGVSGAIIGRMDMTLAGWFTPLAAGDSGVKAISQMQCSASVTGTLAWVVGHLLAIFPMPMAFMPCTWDGLNTMFSLPRIFDDAALGFIELCKPSTTATNYYGSIITVSG